MYLEERNGIFYVVDGASGKTSLNEDPQPLSQLTSSGYKLMWYKPGVGWSDSSNSPGPDWYGPSKWDDSEIPVEYWIDTQNIPAGILEPSFIDYVQKCYRTWQDDPGSYMAYSYQGVRTDKDPGVNDGINIFCWRYIDGPGNTLGVAQTWFQYIPGDYNSLRIVDSDIELDTGDPWSCEASCPPDRFDVQNVGTHECGHTLGLADLYDSEDSEMTMYGYSSKGETFKRDLNWGDQAGVRTLYLSQYYVVVDTPGLDSASNIVHYTEGGIPKIGSVSSGTWSAYCDNGSALSIDDTVTISNSERYHTIDTNSWIISGSQTYTVTYLHQWKPTITLKGIDGGNTVDITARTLDGSSATVSGISSSPWNDWCDHGTTLTFGEYTSGGKMTTDTRSWLVESVFSATISYKASSTITLNCAPSSTSYGTHVTINGSINPTRPNVPVYLSLSTDGGSSWTQFIVVETEMDGSYSVSWSPPYNLTYTLKASWLGDQSYFGSTSSPSTLTVTGVMPEPPSLLISIPGNSFNKGENIVVDVIIFNPTSSEISTTIYIEVSGPVDYKHFDLESISISPKNYSTITFYWNTPDIEGTYQISVILIPPKLGAYDIEQINLI